MYSHSYRSLWVYWKSKKSGGDWCGWVSDLFQTKPLIFNVLAARKIANLREKIAPKLTPVNSQFYVEYSNGAIGLEMDQ